MKAEKKGISGLRVASTFTMKIHELPLPCSYKGVGDLKFSGATDPVEYLIRFNTEMEVYQVKDLTKCRLLVAALLENAHQWFKMLPGDSIQSWRKMCKIFVTQFQALVADAPPVNIGEYQTLRK